MTKVVIVGGGIAGLAAARTLSESDIPFEITLLEASDRLGGRIHTLTKGSSHIELGAQWIHGVEGNIMYDLALEVGAVSKTGRLGKMLKTVGTYLSWIKGFEREWFLNERGERLSMKLIEKIYNEAERIDDMANKYAREAKSPPFSSYGELYYSEVERFICQLKDEKTRSEAKALAAWWAKLQCTDSGCGSLYAISLLGWGLFEELGGEWFTEVGAGGYQSLVDHVISRTQGVTVERNSRVTHITYTDQSVSVCTSSGTVFEGGHVICTLPLGVLKDVVRGEGDAVTFDPALDEAKVNAINRMSYDTVNKIYLQFPHPFWVELGLEGMQFVWSETYEREEGKISEWWFKEILGFDTVQNQPNLLQGWITGPAARYMESLSDSDVISACQNLLMSFLVLTKVNASHLTATSITRTAWRCNPYARGSYSNLSPVASGDEMCQLSLPRPSAQTPRLLFAGEATSSTHFSTTHGAYETGLREAQRLIKLYQ